MDRISLSRTGPSVVKTMMTQQQHTTPHHVFDKNMRYLEAYYPDLAEQIRAFPFGKQLNITLAHDGSPAFSIAQQGKLIQLTNPHNPIQQLQAQVNQWSAYLQDLTRPVLILGLYPGIELISIFDSVEQITTPHCPQPIYVCIDSIICFFALLHCQDISRIIKSPRVRFFRLDHTSSFIAMLKEHPELPHLFTLITLAPGSVVNQVMPLFASLIEERNNEMAQLIADNKRYYDALDDQQLADLIAGKGSRNPRLLIPTCQWSTFIKHSARDTCKAFSDLGWDTCILKMEAMLTPYYLVKQINDFKPDVFLFIDHLRSEAEEVYPEKMMFVTWIQDEMKHLYSPDAGNKLSEYALRGRRDLVIGYDEDRLVNDCNYPRDRFVALQIPANPHIFIPKQLSVSEKQTYGCELAFVSNVSTSSEQMLTEHIIPTVEPMGISRETVREIHDHLWTCYRQGQTFCARRKLLDELFAFDEFEKAYHSDQDADSTVISPIQRELTRLFYWRLNDTIYRHVVLEWAVETDIHLHLYGQGWEHHPQFSKYACGSIAHGELLNTVYQAADFNLHLNITQGMHQRVWEILTCGATPCFREREPVSENEPPRDTMRRFTKTLLTQSDELTDHDHPIIADVIFARAMKEAKQTDFDERSDPQYFEHTVMKKLKNHVMTRPDWILDDWNALVFRDPSSLKTLVTSKRHPENKEVANNAN